MDTSNKNVATSHHRCGDRRRGHYADLGGAMTLTSNTPARLRQLAPATLCPAVALAVMILTAPAAYAESEQSIQDRCTSDGGSYSTTVNSNGDRVSQCCYRTNQGLNTVHHLQCFYYVNGQYDGNTIWNEDQPPVTQPPVAQPGLPPPATAAPGGAMPPAGPQGPQPAQPPPATEAPVIP